MKKIITLLSVVAASLFAGQTVQAQNSVTPLTVNQWVQPGQDGVLTGKIVVPAENGTTSAVKDAEVAVRSNDGTVLRATAKTNAKGEFSIPGVEPGVYSLTARADYIFAVCAMHVLDSDLVGEREFPQTAEIAAANVDFTTVKTAIIRYMPPTNAKISDASIKGAKLDALAARVCGQEAFRVNQFRGGMKGRLLKAGTLGEDLDNVQLTNVFIMQDGVEIARTVTNEAGEFEIGSIGPGNYSLMAVGADGLGLVGFELVKESATGNVMTSSTGKTFVQAPCGCNEFSMQVAPVQDVGNIVSDVVISEQPIMQGGIADGGIIADGGVINSGSGGFAGSGGGFASGGGGGGGGGLLGGSGGLRGIAAIAGIGGIIAATVSDDDDAIVPAPIASPVAPN